MKINAFELCTPKFFGDSYDKDRYDHEQVEYLLKKIANLDENMRALRHKNKMLNLVSIKDADDQDFLEGVFLSTRYGEKQDLIDVNTQAVVGEKEKNHGVKNEVVFLIDKRNGLILTQHDSQGVVGRDMLHRFLKYHSLHADLYREEFNKKNKENNAKIVKSSFIRVASLPSKEFFEELSNFARINEAYVFSDINNGKNNEAIDYFTKQANEFGADNFQELKITLKNNIRKDGIKHVRAFFERLIEADKYDGYGVNGVLVNGQNKSISLEKVPHNYPVLITYNENGIPDRSEILNEMIRIGKFDNPVIDKNVGAIEIIGVGDIDENEQEIGEGCAS